MIANGIKSFRLLTQERASAKRFDQQYPELLPDIKDLMLENTAVQSIFNEARGLVYNLQQVGNLPQDVASIVRGYEPPQTYEELS
jgi:hypothetical protein